MICLFIKSATNIALGPDISKNDSANLRRLTNRTILREQPVLEKTSISSKA